MISVKTRLRVSAVALLAVAAGAVFFLVTLAAYGQTSRPASQPSVFVPAPASMPLAQAALLTPASQPVVTAVAKPASPPVVAPASQPAPVVTWRAWFRDNWRYLLFVVVLPSLITALKKKGARDGLVGFLEAMLERSSVTQPHNSFGTLKWPGQAAGPPVDPPKPTAPPPV